MEKIIDSIREIIIMTIVMLGVWFCTCKIFEKLFGYITIRNVKISQHMNPLFALFIVCLFNAIIIVWYTKRSVYCGRKLFWIVFGMVFIVTFLMLQLEVIYFNKIIKMPKEAILGTFLSGIAVSMVAAVISVKIKARNNHTKMQIKENIEKFKYPIKIVILNIVILSIIYMFFYLLFRYFISRGFPVFREYYTGTRKISPFIQHIKIEFLNHPKLILFQVFRGLIWGLMGYFVVTSVSVKKHFEKYLLVAFVLSVGLCMPLLIPNNFIPYYVRVGHFFELLMENFLFGIILVYLFKREEKKNNKGCNLCDSKVEKM